MDQKQNTTFKELELVGHIDKPLRKSGLSYAIIFSKEDIAKCKLSYGDIIRLDKAEIIKPKSI